jgi:hypothetical protein
VQRVLDPVRRQRACREQMRAWQNELGGEPRAVRSIVELNRAADGS